MASIYGFAEVLLTQELDPASSKEFLGIIFKQSEMMASILNELLDLARIEARRGTDFVFEITPVQALVEKVVREFKLPDGRAPPSLIAAAGHLSMRADPQKVQQAVLNVLSNAYKYSPAGGVVQIELLDSPAHEGTAAQVGIRIADHGIGMTPEQQSHVFERFYRADTSGKILGTGLGMSIVHEIVTLHRGRVELDSQFGVGTTVTLWWPEGLSEPVVL
jgi:signal transduction histidine kinase